MGRKIPGPTCSTQLGDDWIDTGTMCRARSSTPGASLFSLAPLTRVQQVGNSSQNATSATKSSAPGKSPLAKLNKKIGSPVVKKRNGGKFDRNRAVQYALKWALSRNPDFPDYSGTQGGGGDCANFVSQVMLAGGWTPLDEGSWKSNLTAWWSGRGRNRSEGASKTWAAAGYFWSFILHSGRASPCSREELDLGDIVIAVLPSGNAAHVAVVTDIRRSRHLHHEETDLIYLSYHTTDKRNTPLTGFESYYRHLDMKVYYFKVADDIPAEYPQQEYLWP